MTKTTRKPVGWNRAAGGTLVVPLDGAKGDEYSTVEIVGPPSRAYIWVGSDKRGYLGTLTLRRLKAMIRRFERDY